MPLVLAGATSGQATVQATDAATVTLTLPATSGTLSVSGGSPSFATLTVTGDASISGLTVGKGGGAVASNTVIGNGALATATGTSVLATAIGVNALNLNTAGTRTVAVGAYSLAANTTGDHNVAVGSTSMQNNTTGSFNVAMGRDALQANTTANVNTAVGYQAGYGTTTGIGNAYFGTRAGYTNTTSAYNVFLGYEAGYSYNTSGNTFNTFVGTQAGYSVTTGQKNTIIGGYTGNQGGLDIRTASNYIVLSDGDGNPRAYWNGSGTFNFTANAGDVVGNIFNDNAVSPYGLRIKFNNASPNSAGNYFQECRDGGNTLRYQLYSNGGIANYSANNSNLSDQREKKDIELAGNYLDKVCAIPVKTFLYNDQTDTDLNLGVIAQDVQTIAPELVMESNWGTEEDPKMRLSIYQTDLQYALMKAIQELNAKVTALEAQLGAK
jgi:hypothetical protein